MDDNMSDWTRVHKCCESKNVCAYMPLCEYMSGSWVCPDVYLYVCVLEILNICLWRVSILVRVFVIMSMKM